MTTAQLVFLYAAEEKNITRAAERAFVTQQCASRHIANLEQKYGVPLIVRKPVFSLTEAGETLAASLRRMHVLEQETEETIAEISRGASGQISLGINSARARVLLPELIRRYRERFPQVRLTVRSGDTAALAHFLKNGEIDLMLGVNLAYDAQFEVIPLVEDRIFFLATKALAEAYAPRLLKKGKLPESAALSDIGRFPLCRNQADSTLTGLLDRVAAAENLRLDGQYISSDYDLQIEFCGNGIAAAFCPESVLPRVDAWNASGRGGRIQVFEISSLTEKLRIDLIRNREGVRPGYSREFVKLIREMYRNGSGSAGPEWSGRR